MVWTNCAATCRHLWSRPAKTTWTGCCQWPSHSLPPSWWVLLFSRHSVCIITRAEATTDDRLLPSRPYRNLLTSARWLASAAPTRGSRRSCSSTWSRRPSSLPPRPRRSASNFKRLFYLAKRFWLNVLHRQQGQSSSHCSFCIFLVKTLDKLLPKDRTEVCGCYEPIPNIHWRKIPSFIPSSFFFSLCRRPWSTCWRRSAGFCPPPTGTSASQWSAGSARRYWTPSWATPRRRPSAPSYISAEGRRLLLKVSRQ